jgi:O-acetyl-ADP-ribose deacetylase (regulator of RNase III)
VIQGDITVQTADAIVNAANNHLWMGSGIAGAIKHTDGDQIEQEAVSQGPIDVDGAIITSAGALPKNYVLHAAGMGQDLKTDTTKVATATRSYLRLAGEHGQPRVPDHRDRCWCTVT